VPQLQLQEVSQLDYWVTLLNIQNENKSYIVGNFQHVEHVFVVGCGGGIPHYTDANRHVRLGDVVASVGRNAYTYCDALEIDRRTEQVNGFKVKLFTQKDTIIPDTLMQLHELVYVKCMWFNCCCLEVEKTSRGYRQHIRWNRV
jgi:hypothetical protein